MTAKKETKAATTISFVNANLENVYGRNIVRVGDEDASLRPGDIINLELLRQGAIFNEDGSAIDVSEAEVCKVIVSQLGDLVQELNDNYNVFEARRSGLIDTNPFAAFPYIVDQLSKGLDEGVGADTIVTVIYISKSVPARSES